MITFRPLTLLLAIGLAIASCTDPDATVSTPPESSEPAASGESPEAEERSLTPTPADSNFVTDVVAAAAPAVVRINTEDIVEVQSPFSNPFMERFFGEDFAPPEQRVRQGLGSGFIVDASGTIVTNAHVISGADRVTVVLNDGRSFAGDVLGQDPLTDIAVVQIDADDDLPVLPTGNSSTVRVGQWAIAIGNPLGLEETVTVGVISATQRSSADIGVADKRVEFLQTDAAINPGNSGGPLLNARGEVIGVNTAIIGSAQGLGFAVPIDTAARIAEELIATGSVQYPYIGIRMATLTPELERQLEQRLPVDLPETGVLVLEVVPDSPAARAGLRQGDIIEQVDGDPVSDATALQEAIAVRRIGDELTLQVQRDGRSGNVTVELGTLPLPQGE